MSFAWGLGRDIAVDLGTANTLVYVRRKGIVLNEPSVIAINLQTNRIVAVGKAAKRMMGRTPPHIATIRPLKDGVIADLEAAERMLRHFIQKAQPSRFLAKPRVVIAVPSGTNSIEQRAVKEAAYEAGARRVHILEEPMAAAIGAGLKVGEAAGNIIVDIGGGTTEVAIVSMSGVVIAKSLRVGGDEMDEAIIAYVKKEYALLLGERTAERLKIELGMVRRLNGAEAITTDEAVAAPALLIDDEFDEPDTAGMVDTTRVNGSAPAATGALGATGAPGALAVTGTTSTIGGTAQPDAPAQEHGQSWNPFRLRARSNGAAEQPPKPFDPKAPVPVRGRDLVTGLPKTITVCAEEISRAIEDPVQSIIDAVQTTLDQCPAELAGDLLDNGIVLTGGGALLRGLPERLGEAMGMPIRQVDRPLYSVALGAGHCVEHFEAMQDVFLPETYRR